MNPNNVSSIVLFIVLLPALLGQETYKWKTQPKIPYKTPLDASFLNGPFADSATNKFNCSKSRPDSKGPQTEFMPVCALLPTELVRCNAVYICPHDQYTAEIDHQKALNKAAQLNSTLVDTNN